VSNYGLMRYLSTTHTKKVRFSDGWRSSFQKPGICHSLFPVGRVHLIPANKTSQVQCTCQPIWPGSCSLARIGRSGEWSRCAPRCKGALQHTPGIIVSPLICSTHPLHRIGTCKQTPSVGVIVARSHRRFRHWRDPSL